MISVALFNNKGGVGKTTLTYHLAHVLQRLGRTVLAVDLDPQANLTAAFLDESELETLWAAEAELFITHQTMLPLSRVHGRHTVARAVRPILAGIGDVELVEPIAVIDGLSLLPGELTLSVFEDTLSEAWPKGFTGDEAAIRKTTAFYRMIRHAAEVSGAEIVLIDVGPNLGAINRAALLASDTVLIPLAADLFSLLGLHNLGPKLREWRDNWQRLVLPRVPERVAAPAGDMAPLGYVVMQPIMRLDRPVRAYQRWLARIPEMYGRAIVEGSPEPAGSYEVATLRNYRSLMPLALDARKPMFDLRPADGAIGSMQELVQTCLKDFRQLATNLLERLPGQR